MTNFTLLYFVKHFWNIINAVVYLLFMVDSKNFQSSPSTSRLSNSFYTSHHSISLSNKGLLCYIIMSENWRELFATISSYEPLHFWFKIILNMTILKTYIYKTCFKLVARVFKSIKLTLALSIGVETIEISWDN